MNGMWSGTGCSSNGGDLDMDGNRKGSAGRRARRMGGNGELKRRG